MLDNVDTNALRAVHDAFNQDDLKRVCEMHETEFFRAYDMKFVLCDQPAPDNFYLYKDNGSNILAVAHLDTVGLHEDRTARFLDTAAGPVVYSRALDDRLGAYTILELLPALDMKFDWLLTVGEESGKSTAAFFTPPDGKEYHWMIEFDRGGTDVVMYQYEDRETRQLVRDSGAKPETGIFSDISYMSHLEIKGFNWGVGYRDYHGPRAHAYLHDYWMMLSYFLKFHAENADVYLPHDTKTEYQEVESSSRWLYGRRVSSLWDDDIDVAFTPDDGDDFDVEPTEEELMAQADDIADFAAMHPDLISEDWNVVNKYING